jgi:hypothetical protein
MLPQKKNPDIAELAAGQGRSADRQPHRLPRHAQGPPARVQPRPAGGQGAAVRRARPQPRLALVCAHRLLATASSTPRRDARRRRLGRPLAANEPRGVARGARCSVP